MSKSYDVVGYDFNAQRFCPDCMIVFGADAIFQLDEGRQVVHDREVMELWARLAGIKDVTDESSYDSSEYPKVIFRDALSEDGDERCESCDVLLD